MEQLKTPVFPSQYESVQMTSQSICPSCSRPVGQADDFCPRCGTPLTTFATTDPIQSIRAEGEMVRRSMQKPTPIVLIGVWLLFAPPLVLLLLMVVIGLFHSFDNIFGLLFVVPFALFAWLYWSIVRKVTRRFLAARKESEEQEDDLSEGERPPGASCHGPLPSDPSGRLEPPLAGSGERNPMTESEWLACTDPGPMVEFLRDKASDRRLRLFACACCRNIWHLVEDQPNRQAVEIVERHADGNATEEEKTLADENVVSADKDGREPDPDDNQAWAAYEAQTAVWQCLSLTPLEACKQVPASAASAVSDAVGNSSSDSWKSAMGKEAAEQAKILVDIFGNPFRPATLDPTWLTPTVKALAQSIYTDRTFDQMPALADALVKSGCANEEILDHLRGPGPHVRGCWALDLVLGKE